MRKINILKLSVLLASLSLIGCASTKPEVTASPVVQSYSYVDLSNIPTNINRKFVDNQRDVRQVVELAISLSDRGKHADSAEVFLKAYADFKSRDAKLGRDLLSAAICELFSSGQITRVREELVVLDSYKKNVYDKFSDNKNIENIRAIINKK